MATTPTTHAPHCPVKVLRDYGFERLRTEKGIFAAEAWKMGDMVSKSTYLEASRPD